MSKASNPASSENWLEALRLLGQLVEIVKLHSRHQPGYGYVVVGEADAFLAEHAPPDSLEIVVPWPEDSESHSDFTDSGGDPRPRLYP